MNYINFKALIASRNLPWFYRDLPDRFEFKTYEGPISFDCIIFKAAATPGGFCPVANAEYVADFEANHRSGAIDIS